MRRAALRSSSEDSDTSSAKDISGGPSGPREQESSSSENGGDDEHRPPTNVVFQSSMDPAAPVDILRELQRQRRFMELCFRDLDNGLQDINRRFDEQRTYTDKRFSEQDERFDDLFRELQAQRTNRGATHINSRIELVRNFDSKGRTSTPMPDGYPTRVYEFLRLKNRRKSRVLADLLHFYDVQSWSTWGLASAWADTESDLEELLAPEHTTLEAAVEFAPDFALQELALYIGLDYDKIMINRDEDERLQESRNTHGKRVLLEESPPAKREKQDEAPVQKQADDRYIGFQVTEKPKTEVLSFDGTIGWDTRRTEERTPPELKPRLKDAAPSRPRALSPTSVATSASAQLPTRDNL